MEELLVSLTGTPFPKWMKWFALVVGILLVGDGMRSFAFHKILVGAVLAEQHDAWAEQRRYIGLDVLTRCRAALTDPAQPADPTQEVSTTIVPALTA